MATELVFYDWAADVPQSVLDAFSAEYGVEVIYVPYEAQEEAIENIRAGKVYDVVVLDNVFTGFKVLNFHSLLGVCDPLCDQLRLNRHVLFHAEFEHQVLHPLAAEDPKQIVLQRQIEFRTSGVALAS